MIDILPLFSYFKYKVLCSCGHNWSQHVNQKAVAGCLSNLCSCIEYNDINKLQLIVLVNKIKHERLNSQRT